MAPGPAPASRPPAKPTAGVKPDDAAKPRVAKGTPQTPAPPGKAPAHGRLDGEGVVVADVAQANRLHNKSGAGAPQTDNALRLSLVEAAYCVSQGWLDVAGPQGPCGVAELLAAGAAGGHRTEVDYLTYRDLRDRGLVARHAAGAGHFDVWPRGTGHGPPAYQVVACADGDAATGADFLDGCDGLVACVVDADAAVTHYRVSAADPQGTVPAGPLPAALGKVLADRVLVDDAAACAAYARQFLGTAHGAARFLSLGEAACLVAEGALRLDDAAAFQRATRAHPAHDVTVQVLRALRARGLVAKSGLRFGTHLRAYAADPDQDHAPWLLHCATPMEPLEWSSLARGVRLAHGVRKQFLLALVPDGAGDGAKGVRFVHLAWFRP